jgi:hypothetical protein
MMECDKCGHPIGEHDTEGCQTGRDVSVCPCPVRILAGVVYTQAEIRAIRRRNGLPGSATTDYTGYKPCGHPGYRNTHTGPQVNDCGCNDYYFEKPR